MYLEKEQLAGYPFPTSPDIIQIRFHGEIEDVLDDAGIEVYHYPNLVEKFDDYQVFLRMFTDKLLPYYHGTPRSELFVWVESNICDRLFNYRLIELQISTQRIVCPIGWIQNEREKTKRDWFEDGEIKFHL